MKTLKATFQAMGGQGEITLATADPQRAAAAIEAAVDEVKRIEAKYSRYRPDSLLSQINRSAGTDIGVALDPETATLLAHADQLYQRSGGLFDLSSGLLRTVWRFDQAVPALPSPGAVQAVLRHIGWPAVRWSATEIRLPQGMEIDLGGLGKEYATDRAAEVLRAHGFAHGLVNLAGDLHVLGPQPDGRPWGVGVQSPRTPGVLLASIPLQGGGFATSGDYERFFELEGRRYCHLLNPHTGYPVTHWQSVSVAGPDALSAGSHATLAMLMQAQGLDFLRQSGLRFLAIDQSGQIFTS